MNRQKLILISIFVVTFVIGFSAILVSILFTSGPKKPATTTQTTSQVPSLASVKLYCSSASSGTSLTLIWQLPTNMPATDVVKGQITDISTQADPVTIGPFNNTQTNYVYTGANGVDTYYASLWIEDSNGNKGDVLASNQLNSSQCTTGQAPVAPAITTATPTPTPTQAQATTTTTATPTPTPTVTKTSTLACNTFTLQQNGTTLTSNSVSPGSSVLTIVPGITSPSGGVLNYSAAQWSINPTSPALTVSSDQSSATWTPPTTATSSSYTVTLAGVTDSNSNTLASACSVTITMASSTLPKTAGETPTQVLFFLGIVSMGIGLFFFTRRENQNI